MTELMNNPNLVGSYVTFAMGSFDGCEGRIVAISDTQPDGLQDGDTPFVDIMLYGVEDVVESCGPLAYVIRDKHPSDRARELVGSKIRFTQPGEFMGLIGTITDVYLTGYSADWYDTDLDKNHDRVTVEFPDGRICNGTPRSHYELWEPPVFDDVEQAQLQIAELTTTVDQLKAELEAATERTATVERRIAARERELIQAAMDYDIDGETLDHLEIERPKMRCVVTVKYLLKGRRYSGGNSLDEGFIRSSLDDLDISLDSDWNSSDTECDVLGFEVDGVELDAPSDD